MYKYPAKLTDDNYKKIAELKAKKGCSLNDIINHCIAEYSEDKEDKIALQIIKSSQRESEKKLSIIYSALNNFFLNFAPDMEDYVQPYISEHTWLKQAAKDEESKLQMKATKKKWSGDAP